MTKLSTPSTAEQPRPQAGGLQDFGPCPAEHVPVSDEELKWRLSDIRHGLEQSAVVSAIDEWRAHL